MKRLSIYLSIFLSIVAIGFIVPISFDTDRLYTHLFYISIALTSIWYSRYTVFVGCFFAMQHIFVEFVIKQDYDPQIIIRACIIVFVSIVLHQMCHYEKLYQKKIQILSYENYHDRMTNIYNRVFFQDYLKAIRQFPTAIIICDIDGLKITNDTYGHEQGDYLIITTASILRNITQDQGFCSRLGGDEFGVILPGFDDKQTLAFLKILEDAVLTHNQTAAHNQQIQFSKGYQICKSSNEVQNSVHLADQHMYMEKKTKHMNH